MMKFRFPLRIKSHQSCCSSNISENTLHQLGIDAAQYDYVIALAGNPNTGKSTVFNALTGLRQHTGNWPGKTVVRAEGGFQYLSKRYQLIDLPGTYSLLSASTDEEIARNFILFAQPDCTIVVVDATCLERNLNLALQVLEITEKAVIALNLFDEAKRKGIEINHQKLSSDLGVPVVPTIAKTGKGINLLLKEIAGIVSGTTQTHPYRIQKDGAILKAVEEVNALLQQVCPRLPNSNWVAMRLLDGDPRIQEALLNGELATLYNEKQIKTK